jgi:glycerophosphoryl diester phosphodiesterase
MSRQVLEGARSVSGRPAVQAHRGSPDPTTGVRENTLAAFVRARELGADGVELDVRLTADGGLAVHHDPVIAGAGAVHLLSTAELPAHVPLLAEALEACAGMIVNIEVKNLPIEPAFDSTDRCARDVVDLVVAAGLEGSVVVSSFWGGALAAVRESAAALRTGLLVVPSFDPDAAVTGAVDLGCSAVHLPIGLVRPDTVSAAHAAGLDVAAWTVADGEALTAVLGARVDTIVTDDVAMVRRVVDQG